MPLFCNENPILDGNKEVVSHGDKIVFYLLLQKSRYLQKMASGQLIGAFCMADAACGSDAESTSVRATHLPEEEKFFLTG